MGRCGGASSAGVQLVRVARGGDHLTEPTDQRGAIRGCTNAERYEGGIAMAFRLPAIEDFEGAAAHGVRVVISSFDDLLWWSSSSAPDGKAWAYSEGRGAPWIRSRWTNTSGTGAIAGP